MGCEEFKDIVSKSGFGHGDILTADDWNSDYSIDVNLTVKEIRSIYKRLLLAERVLSFLFPDEKKVN